MKYIIDEIELKNIIYRINYLKDKPNYGLISNFLKDKKPVEMIASGKVYSEFNGERLTFIEREKSGIQNHTYIDSYLNKYIGKSIKIYIESE